MRLSKVFLKRRYLDLRLGGVTINPLIQASNFVMISYLVVSDSIPFWIFAPLFFLAVCSSFSVAGLFFRTKQLSTDENLKYEQQTDFNKTLYQLMTAQANLLIKNGFVLSDEFKAELEKVRKRSED